MPRQTYFAKTGELDKTWHHIDADGKILGRIATEIATILMGKHRPEYTPHVDSGDCVIVTNAENVVMTGRKLEQKTLQSFSGYPGGQKVQTYRTVMEKDPTRVVRQAIIRMLPSGPLGREMEGRLKVYAESDHPHVSQQPVSAEA